MDVAVVGTGYVGLVSAACLASMGNRVRCFDIDRARIAGLRHGVVPLREPRLDGLVAEGRSSGLLTFHDDQGDLRGADLVLVSVGTLAADGQWTDRNVHAAVMGLAADPACPRAIALRSTLLPGTTRVLAESVRRLDPAVELAVCPEFTREGAAVADFLAPDRIVIGIDRSGDASPARPDETAARPEGAVELLRRLFGTLGAPFLVTDSTSAEAVKMGANAFLAAKITFANEMARLALAADADPYAVLEGIGLDRRIGRSFLAPGPGYGGSCLPSQARALPEFAAQVAARTPLIDAIARSNGEQTEWVVGIAEAGLGRAVSGTRVAVLGQTFKAGTDDLRESPAVHLVGALARRGARVTAHDPVAPVRSIEALWARERIAARVADSVAGACAGADAVFVATEWNDYRAIGWDAVAPSMRGRLVVDVRGVVDRTAAAAAGLHVIGLSGTPRAFSASPETQPEPVGASLLARVRSTPARARPVSPAG